MSVGVRRAWLGARVVLGAAALPGARCTKIHRSRTPRARYWLHSHGMGPTTVERTPERRPIVLGVIVMTVYGCGWALLAISGVSLPAGALVALVAIAVAVTATVLSVAKRSIDRLAPHAGAQRIVSPTAGHYFHLINAAQTIVIVVAVLALVRFGQGNFIPVVVCMVVGAHFLPLARIFDLPLYRWTGLLLILTATLTALALTLGLSAEHARVAVGVPAALILWGTASTLARQG